MGISEREAVFSQRNRITVYWPTGAESRIGGLLFDDSQKVHGIYIFHEK